jgi:N6-L-threonylcarbamoyladenine synthase
MAHASSTTGRHVLLGIETSCDETAAAVVDGECRILAEAVRSQLEEHAPFGGVVPEIAARAHVQVLDRLIDQVMRAAGLRFEQLAGIAATAGPGLIGGLIVGLTTAKAIAAVHRLPLVAVNHLEAHALTARLTHGLAFPYLLLLISGGHCQLLIVHGVGRYERLGTTLDDALGEALDKAAKLLGLGFPGGPLIEMAARLGERDAFDLPRPMVGRDDCHFSFAGLKTALRHLVQRLGPKALEPPTLNHLCASFEAAAADALIDRTGRAITRFRARGPVSPTLVAAGGVAANRYFGGRLAELAAARGLDLVVPPPALCTDNAVMVAWAGIERLRLGLVDPLSVPARARWPLDAAAEPAPGAGVKA